MNLLYRNCSSSKETLLLWEEAPPPRRCSSSEKMLLLREDAPPLRRCSSSKRRCSFSKEMLLLKKEMLLLQRDAASSKEKHLLREDAHLQTCKCDQCRSFNQWIKSNHLIIDQHQSLNHNHWSTVIFASSINNYHLIIDQHRSFNSSSSSSV